MNVHYKKIYYFPLTHHLQRLYASNTTVNEEGGVMRHSSDSPAWKHFDQMYPSFAAETQNVRLGLYTNGFQPFGQTGQQYSSWPMIVTPYNLPS